MKIILLIAISMLLFSNQEQPISSESHEPLPNREMKDSVEVFIVNGVTFEMVRVDDGSFRMGGTVYNDEEPVHYEYVPTFFFSGGNDVDKVAWYDENSCSMTHPGNSQMSWASMICRAMCGNGHRITTVSITSRRATVPTGCFAEAVGIIPLPTVTLLSASAIRPKRVTITSA